jgi:Family of unknown function (DUF6292)
MRPTEHDDRGRGPMSQFAKSRARALREQADHRDRAVRTVAGQARDRDEFTGLLSMLGLDSGQGDSAAFSQALARYVGQVAAAVAVPADAVGYEVSDSATAYLGLAARLSDHAGRDLMLVWDERLGWYVGVETRPDETPLVICYFGGESVPPIAAVARFVADALAGRRPNRLRPVLAPSDRITLARRMAERTEA